MTAGTRKARRIIRAFPLMLLDIVATGFAYIIAAAHFDGAFGNFGLFKRQIPEVIIARSTHLAGACGDCWDKVSQWIRVAKAVA